ARLAPDLHVADLTVESIPAKVCIRPEATRVPGAYLVEPAAEVADDHARLGSDELSVQVKLLGLCLPVCDQGHVMPASIVDGPAGGHRVVAVVSAPQFAGQQAVCPDEERRDPAGVGQARRPTGVGVGGGVCKLITEDDAARVCPEPGFERLGLLVAANQIIR